MRVVVVITGALLAAASAQAQSLKDAPVCKAELSGDGIVTRIQFADGYSVEGPWRLTGRWKAKSATSVKAVLDRIVEIQPVSHARQTTPLPGAVEMTFSGNTFDDVLIEAAHVWCMTVIQARPPAQADAGIGRMLFSQGRVM